MEATGITDIGKVRKTNEDSFLISFDNEPYFMLVADGMGGHAAGEVASRLAAESIEKHIKDLGKNILDKSDIEEAVLAANRTIVEKVSKQPELEGMGTTLTLALLNTESYLIAQVGDSRAYLIEGNSAKKITKDHTYVQHLIDCGVIKTGAADDYPFKNIITRALGMQNLKVDLYEGNWNVGDALLLCSDGLSGYVNTEQMSDEIRTATDLKTAAQNLVNLALNSGGKDNITIVIARNSDLMENGRND